MVDTVQCTVYFLKDFLVHFVLLGNLEFFPVKDVDASMGSSLGSVPFQSNSLGRQDCVPVGVLGHFQSSDGGRSKWGDDVYPQSFVGYVCVYGYTHHHLGAHLIHLAILLLLLRTGVLSGWGGVFRNVWI